MDPTVAAILAERSKLTLSRAEMDHPKLTQLRVTMVGTVEGQFWPTSSDDLSKLGGAIGRNTRLERMEVHFFTHELEKQIMDSKEYFDGLKRNRSIKNLSMFHCIFEGIQCDILDRFVASMPNLEEIVIFGASLANGGIGRVVSAAAACKNLQRLSVMNSQLQDGDVSEITAGIGGMHQLRHLDLSMSHFGREGVEALGSLLRDPGCNLTYLGLANNRIDDECAEILTASLKGNKKLRKLGIGRHNNLITERGWRAFVQILCKTESISSTYLSNHTLCDIEKWDVPEDLTVLLNLNVDRDKKTVAVRKMLRHHLLPSMKTFIEWELKMLPTAVSWFDDTRRHVARSDAAGLEGKKLTAIYQFARAMPLMIVPPEGRSIVETPSEAGHQWGGTVVERLLVLLLALWKWSLSLTYFHHMNSSDGADRVKSDKSAAKPSVLQTDLNYVHAKY